MEVVFYVMIIWETESNIKEIEVQGVENDGFLGFLMFHLQNEGGITDHCV